VIGTAFTSSGDSTIGDHADYHSSNTQQLDVTEVEELLLRLPEMRQVLAGL
jgi:hypothetical protein